MKRLLIDMDGVLSDIYGQFANYEYKDIGLIQSAKDLSGKLENEAFKNHDKYVNSKNFFYTASPIKDSIDVVEKLNSIYQIFIVSSATQFPLSLTEKNKSPGYNTGLAKVAVSFSADTFVVNQTLALRINIRGKIATFAKPENVTCNGWEH